MNIWIVNHHAYTPEMSAGTRHFELSKELNKLGHNSYVIASSFFHKSKIETKLKEGEEWKFEEIEGAKFIWIKTPAYSNNLSRIKNMFSFKNNVLKLFPQFNLPKPDVIIGSSPHLLSGFVAMQLAKKFQCPFVLEIRDVWPETIIEIGGHSKFHPFIMYLSWLEKTLYKNAKGIISLLPLTFDYLESKGVNRKKIIWLPNGVNFEKLVYHPKEKGKVFTFLYAGAHGLANALDSQLEAIALLNEKIDPTSVRFSFFGDGPLKPKLIEQAKSLGLTNVHFENPVSKSKIFDEMAKADGFFFTLKAIDLYKYGISYNKMYDFMAVGRPMVIGSGCAYNPIKESSCGIVSLPENPESMAEALYEMLQLSDHELITMGKRGHDFCKEKHSFEVLANNLVTYLENEIVN